MVRRNDIREVRVLNPSLEESELRGGTIILRGSLDTKTLFHLRYDVYQRETLSPSRRNKILKALKSGQPLPDIELAMRTSNYIQNRDGSISLTDDVYVVDGRQRIATLMEFFQTNPDYPGRLGATIHFSTDREWETARFEVVNMNRNKVNPAKILHNSKETSPGLGALFGLSTNDRQFALYQKVCWAQNMTRTELITARTFAVSVAWLHHHKVAGKSPVLRILIPSVNKIAEVFGIKALRDNTRTFYELIDECWGLRHIQYRAGAAQIKGTFLAVLATVLSEHSDFWSEDGRHLLVSPDMRRRFATFPISDPEIQRLASSSGQTTATLKFMLLEHLNKGKHKKLRPWVVKDVVPPVETVEAVAA